MSILELAQLPLFNDLSAEQLELLQPLVEICSYSKDTIVFEQGQEAIYLYIVMSGDVSVRYKPYDGTALTVATVHSGGVFGWSAALGRDNYTSGALCLTDCTAYRIAGKKLHLLCEKYPETGVIILEKLTTVITERLRNTHDQVLSLLTQAADETGECLRRQENHDREQY